MLRADRAAPCGELACFLTISRLSSRTRGDSLSSLAFIRNASSPPRWSTRLERIGRDPQLDRASERVRDQRDVEQVGQEPPLGLAVRMAHLVADLGALSGQVAAA